MRASVRRRSDGRPRLPTYRRRDPRAGRRARRVQGHRAAPAGRLRELPQARRRRSTADEVDRATGKLAEALLPVLDACEAAFVQHPDEVEPLLNLMLGELRKHGLEAIDLHDQPFDPTVADAVPTSPATAASRSSPRCCAPATRWKGRVLRPAMVQGRGTEVNMAAQREWFEKDYYEVLGVAEHGDAEGDHQGVPQARARAPPRQEPGRRRGRGAVQGGLRRLRRARRRGQAQGVRRGPPARTGRWRGRRRRAGRLQLQRRRHARAAGSATCSGRCSAAAARGARRVRRRAPARAAATTSQAELTLDFADAVRGITTTLHLTTDAQCSTCNGSGRQAGHVAEALLALRRARRHRRQPGLLLVLVAVPALRGVGDGHRGSVPDVPRHAASRSAPARCRRGSRPASPTARRSGSRVAARRVATAARPATCSSSATSTPHRAVRPRRQRPHRHGARSRSPRPRSAATSTCRRSTARR